MKQLPLSTQAGLLAKKHKLTEKQFEEWRTLLVKHYAKGSVESQRIFNPKK